MFFLNLGQTQTKTAPGAGGGAPAAPTSTQSIDFDRGLSNYAVQTTPTAAISSGISATMSVGMWIKTSETTGASVFPFIGHYNGPGNYKWWLGMQGSLGTAGRLRFVSSGNGTAANVYDQGTGALVNTGAWVHVAATYNGSGNVVLYINGSSVLTAAASDATLHNYTGDFTIARVVGGGSPLYWQGRADEVALFDVELNSTEISELYNGGVTYDVETHSRNADLVGYWYMGDGDTYPTLTDQKGANDLTMTNMVAGDIVSDAP